MPWHPARVLRRANTLFCLHLRLKYTSINTSPSPKPYIAQCVAASMVFLSYRTRYQSRALSHPHTGKIAANHKPTGRSGFKLTQRQTSKLTPSPILPSASHQLSPQDNVPPAYSLRPCEALSCPRHYPRPAPVLLVRRAQYVTPKWSDPTSPDICQTSHSRLNWHSTRSY